MLYAYRFKTIDELRRFSLYMIHNRVPDKNSKLEIFNIDNIELVNLYEEENYERLFRYLHVYYPFTMEICKINGEDVGFIYPSDEGVAVHLFDDDNNTSIQSLKTSENTEAIRDFIYLMESNFYDYIAKQLEWHIIYDTRDYRDY